MPYMNLDHLELYYEEFGYGEPILFLHSHFSRGILAFSAQIQPFAGNIVVFFLIFEGMVDQKVKIYHGIAEEMRKICLIF